MKKVIGICLVLFLGLVTIAQSQPGYNWPEDPKKREIAEEYLVTMSDDLKLKDYASALPKVEWLVENAPNVHKSLYINGAKVYSGLVKASKGDKEKVDLYEDKTLEMYDKRIEYFGSEANVLNRKGQKAWVYYKDRPEKVEEVFNLYKKIFELNGDKTYSANTVAYMDMACKMKDAGKLTDEQVLEVSDEVIKVLDAHSDDQGYQKMRAPVEGKLAGCVSLDCDKIKTTLYPKFQAKPELKMAKTIFRQMNSGGCTSDPVFFEMMMYIEEQEPSCGMKFIIAKRSVRAKKYDQALKFYNLILEQCDAEKKAEVYFEMAMIYKRKGDKTSARSHARKSIAAGSDFKKASHELIGDLYFGSFKQCATADMLKNRTIYIAAYNQYQLAGNGKKMATAKAQFPSAAEIFTPGKKVGDAMNTGCWIGETVKLAKRPAGE